MKKLLRRKDKKSEELKSIFYEKVGKIGKITNQLIFGGIENWDDFFEGINETIYELQKSLHLIGPLFDETHPHQLLSSLINHIIYHIVFLSSNNRQFIQASSHIIQRLVLDAPESNFSTKNIDVKNITNREEFNRQIVDRLRYLRTTGNLYFIAVTKLTGIEKDIALKWMRRAYGNFSQLSKLLDELDFANFDIYFSNNEQLIGYWASLLTSVMNPISLVELMISSLRKYEIKNVTDNTITGDYHSLNGFLKTKLKYLDTEIEKISNYIATHKISNESVYGLDLNIAKFANEYLDYKITSIKTLNDTLFGDKIDIENVQKMLKYSTSMIARYHEFHKQNDLNPESSPFLSVFLSGLRDALKFALLANEIAEDDVYCSIYSKIRTDLESISIRNQIQFHIDILLLNLTHHIKSNEVSRLKNDLDTINDLLSQVILTSNILSLRLLRLILNYYLKKDHYNKAIEELYQYVEEDHHLFPTFNQYRQCVADEMEFSKFLRENMTKSITDLRSWVKPKFHKLAENNELDVLFYYPFNADKLRFSRS